MRVNVILGAIVLFFFVPISLAKASEPISYEDCLLRYLPGTQSDKAALLINLACQNKMKEGKRQERQECGKTPDDPCLDSTGAVTNPEVIKQLEDSALRPRHD